LGLARKELLAEGGLLHNCICKNTGAKTFTEFGKKVFILRIVFLGEVFKLFLAKLISILQNFFSSLVMLKHNKLERLSNPGPIGLRGA
jgi:hypothetical protein